MPTPDAFPQVTTDQLEGDADHLFLTPAQLVLPTTDRLVKLMDRKARLMGLDLQAGIQVTLVTRESLALSLGWDDVVIEGEATEITEEAEA